jgi:hypothetical protein
MGKGWLDRSSRYTWLDVETIYKEQRLESRNTTLDTNWAILMQLYVVSKGSSKAAQPAPDGAGKTDQGDKAGQLEDKAAGQVFDPVREEWREPK